MFWLWGELGFLNCDDVCMCVVNMQFELLEFVFNSVYLTCCIMRFISVLLLGLCDVCSPCGRLYVDWLYKEIYLSFTTGFVWCCSHGYPWFVCKVVLVPRVVGVVT